MMTAETLTAAVPLPALLAGGATVVIGTAAALTGRAASRPEPRTTRWYRPLPRAVTAAVDHPTARAALRTAVLALITAVLVLLVGSEGPVDGAVIVPAVVVASLACGPLVRIADPVHLLDRWSTGTSRPVAPPMLGWPAVLRLVAVAAVVLTFEDGRVLAAALTIHVATQAALAVQHGPAAPARHDPVEAIAAVVTPLAPIGRDPAGQLAWRNPLVTAAHTPQPAAAAWVTAVLMGMALHVGRPGAAALATAAVATVLGRVVLRLGVIREWFTGVLAPLAAAHGLLAAGRWLAPLDLIAFVGLHAVAVAVLHRQAIARHDLRAARAVQLPPRLAVLVSVLTGLTVAASAT